MATLQVRTPDHSPSAAQPIGHVLQLAAALLDRDAAYVRDGTVYGRTSPAAAAGLDRADGARAGRGVPRPSRGPRQGRPARRRGVAGHRPTTTSAGPAPGATAGPGWHAECAAMVLALFGSSVDIHCGGADLAYPAPRLRGGAGRGGHRRDAVRPRLDARRHRVDQRREDGEVDGQSRAGRGPAARPHRPAPSACSSQPAVGRAVVVRPGRAGRRRGTLEQLYARGVVARSGAGRGRRAGRPARRPQRAAGVYIALEDGGQAARTLIELLALS